MSDNTIADLKPDPRNARKHNPRNIGMIRDALGQVGAARSIVIDEDNIILAGNGVIEAAADAGIERVQVVDADGETIIAVRRSGLTAEQKRKLALYDNRAAELAEWDVEQLVADLGDGLDFEGVFGEDELQAILEQAADDLLKGNAEPPEAQPDRAEELRGKWQTERGQVWEIPSATAKGKCHRLMCGDSTSAEDVGRLFDGARPLLMVTDPPYGVEYDPNWRNEAAAEGKLAYAARRIRKVNNDDRADWSDAYALFPGKVLYAWSPGGDHIILTGQAVQAAGFVIRNQIIWAKPHFPISRGAYTYRHEPCWYAVKKGEKAHWQGPANESTLWEIALDKNVEGGHSTQKPLECMARPIRNHEGDVYDPFIGSGTTLVAAEMLARICYAMDIDPAYVAVALERMASMGLGPRLV